jgi:hypothetical protein
MIELYAMVWRIIDQQQQLERLILFTETSEKRNALTDANIHLLAAIDKLRDVSRMSQ